MTQSSSPVPSWAFSRVCETIARMRKSERLVELRRELIRYQPHRGLAIEPILEEIRELFRAHNAILYQPEPYEHGWDLEFSAWVGPDAQARRAGHRGLVQASPVAAPRFAAYDPLLVQPAQRNRCLTVNGLIELEASAAERHKAVWRVIDGKREDQLRVLVCHGPRMLGWFGIVRDAPFSDVERQRLQSLVAALRARLQSDRAARSAATSQAVLDQVLKALPDAAFIFNRFGRLEWCNSLAEELLEGPVVAQEGVRALFEAVRVGRGHPEYSITSLDAPGCRGYKLATRAAAFATAAALVAQACRAWRVSRVQARVLERLAIGESNKQIAAALACAEVTIERHVTSLLRASGASSRTGLLARMLALSSERDRGG